MKRFAVIMLGVLAAWTSLPAATPPSQDQGYVFTSNLQSHARKSLKSRVKSTITVGHVAVADENNDLAFHSSDVCEYIQPGNGAFHKYYPPAQDNVPAEYLSAAAFNKAVRKVRISPVAPAGWEEGKRYTFVPSHPYEYINQVTVRVVRLAGGDATIVTQVDDDFKPTEPASLAGEPLIEIAIHTKDATENIYWHNGQQVMLACNLGGECYSTLEVDDKGFPYATNEKNVRQRDARLSYIFGEIPFIEYFGWISATEIVVDDFLFVAENAAK